MAAALSGGGNLQRGLSVSTHKITLPEKQNAVAGLVGGWIFKTENQSVSEVSFKAFQVGLCRDSKRYFLILSSWQFLGGHDSRLARPFSPVARKMG
ncbi:MAG: hypothetical protein K8R38_09030 [Verrucomicrobia bacterium]|nr:hypothetical protein [Verrucomicrobiota bacterium]